MNMSLGLILVIAIAAAIAPIGLLAIARSLAAASARPPLRRLPPPEIIYFVIGCATALYVWFAFVVAGSALQTLLLLMLMSSVGVVYRIAGRGPGRTVAARRDGTMPPSVAGRSATLAGLAALMLLVLCGIWFVRKASIEQQIVATAMREEALAERIEQTRQEIVRIDRRTPSNAPATPSGTAADVEREARLRTLRTLEAERDAVRGAAPNSTPQDAFAVRMPWMGFLVLLLIGGGVVGLVHRQIVERRRADARHPTHEFRTASLPDSAFYLGPSAPRFAPIVGASAVALGASIVLARLVLIVRGAGPALEQWAWLVATASAGAVTVLVLESLLVRGDADRHPARRRMLHALGGCFAGFVSWCVYRYLHVDLPFEYGEWGVGVRQWSECYDAASSPLWPAFVLYFGLTSFLTAWWHNLPQGRHRRGTFDFSYAAVAVLWAGAVHFVVPFPQPWGMLAQATIVLTVQFAAPRGDEFARVAPTERRGAA